METTCEQTRVYQVYLFPDGWGPHRMALQAACVPRGTGCAPPVLKEYLPGKTNGLTICAADWMVT